MKTWILTGGLLMGMCTAIQAQTVTGRLLDEKNTVIPFANVALLRLPDSSLHKGVLSDSAGMFLFEGLQQGKYLLRVQTMGFQRHFQTVDHNSSLGDLILTTTKQQLSGVTVTGRKPLIEQKLDRLVMNVEGTVMSEGNTALELLGKSPGVTITDDGKVSIKGRTGSMVMINGKQTYLSGDQLVNLLRSTNSSDISRVEIIANPSSKEDAAGNGGIVNIVLKKNTKEGLNGSVSVNGGAGRGARMGGNVMLNYRRKNFQVFGIYNQFFSNLRRESTVERDFYDNHADLQQYSRQFTKVLPELRSNNFRTGLDWSIDSNNSIGVLVNGGFGRYPTVEPTTNELFNHPSGTLQQRANTNTVGKQRWEDMLYNINYVHRFNQQGHEMTADIDYVYHFDRMDQQLDTRFTDQQGLPLRVDAARRGDIPSQNDIYVAKVDYVLPLPERLKLETGWKGSLVRMENDLKYDTLHSGGFVPDASTSNHFIYKEQIQAGYVNLRKDWRKLSLQAGMRGEYTQTRGDQLTTGDTFTRYYFYLFPSMFLNYTTNQEHKWQLGYSRRIQRPSFWDMNPFRVYADPFFYYEGNPQLLPSLVNALEAGYSFRSVVHTVLSYSRATNVSGTLVGISGENITFEKPSNIGTSTNYGLSITSSSSFFPWWSGTYVANVYYNEYRILAASIPITRSGATFEFNTQHTFTLGGGWKAEFNGLYHSGGVDGIVLYRSRYQLSAGVQKDILRGKGNIKFMMNDITRGNNYRYTLDFGNVRTYTAHNPDNRYGLFSFTWRFGQGDGSTKKRSTGGEELKDRLK